MSAPSPGERRLSSAVASASGSSSGSLSGSSSDAMAGDPVGSQATQTPTPTSTISTNSSTNSTAISTNSSTSSSSNATFTAANATDDGFASSYGDESASGASDANVMYRRTQGTCAYYPVDSSGCRAPRSCFDCLNYDVAPERAGCMVSERGQCVTMTGNYSLARDFHFAAAANANATSSANGSASGSGSGSYVGANVTVLSATGYEFAAANATYCATNDTKCAACRRGVFLDYDTASITTTSLFCTGADGCVCIALCELDAWATRVGGSQCQSTTTITVSGVGGSSSGNTTAVNSGAGGAGSDDSTYGGVRGVDTNSGDSIKLGAFWNAAFGVIGVLALALVVVIFLSKQHQRTRQRQDRTGTPQAPVISPRADPRPPESLIEFLVRRPRRDQHQSSAGRNTIGGATTRSSRATIDGDEGEDGGLRLAGWKAMRQELIEKETLRPEIGASGIQRVAISHCLPVGCNPDSTNTLAADCVSPREQRRNPFNEVDDDAILGNRMQRFTARSLSSSAYMSPPSDAIAFMDEIDEVFDDEHGHDNDALDCFDELTTPPARIQPVSGTKL